MSVLRLQLLLHQVALKYFHGLFSRDINQRRLPCTQNFPNQFPITTEQLLLCDGCGEWLLDGGVDRVCLSDDEPLESGTARYVGGESDFCSSTTRSMTSPRTSRETVAPQALAEMRTGRRTLFMFADTVNVMLCRGVFASSGYSCCARSTASCKWRGWVRRRVAQARSGALTS